ncbi:TRAF3-interacting protein [Chloropicon primus]|uniref:TRAF3-interacting protein 1 n=1 Tax=Chloropicon primus TaxID=1764295 RepID=A0A5B8ML25_9CHLO|nr:TRAF3-interacting protein [Chloropicon primus]UPQ99946.1 TRAF3-interacting protein [Chloropicon primus]|eukprot:QDZ20734.1 TRAF3-interacting protein [Chloropicon primus]
MTDGGAFWEPTQSILQGGENVLVRKPKLTENLLKKPPFRFLHDVISEVIRSTGFAKDLYDEHESNSKNVKDKESKVAYLNKIIDYVSEASGTRVPVRPLKVVAGLEPELTNQFLQVLGRVASSGKAGEEDVTKEKENKEPAAEKAAEEEKQAPVEAAPPKEEEKKRKVMPRPEFVQQEEKTEGPPKPSASEGARPEQASLPPRTLQRPMSARKAPPKVKSNVEDDSKVSIMSSMTSGDDGRSSKPNQVGTKGILRDGESDDEDDDEATEIIMGTDAGPANFNMLDAPQGGKLVRDIVETAQNIQNLDDERNRAQGADGGAKPTGIILGRRRSVAAEASAKPVEKMEDMEKVRGAIQKLCQSTNPLVTSVENLQEDVEQMLREAKYWGQEQKIYKQKLNEANQMQNDFNEYRYKIQDLEEEIQIMQSKITNIKAQILSNDKRCIDMLNLAVGGVL